MSKHTPSFTPGPWRWTAVKGGWDGVEDSTGQLICALSLNVPENARLIAAAPRLLEALKDVAESLNCGDGTHYCPNCDKSMYKVQERARAAIEEAEGEG